MKRRLSDADELAFWHLAHHVSRDEHRATLTRIHVADGRAFATAAHRLLSVPVEADWTGTVDRHDALIGGTVEVGPVDSDAPNFDDIVKGCRPGGLHLSRRWVNEHLRPWCGRRDRYAKEWGAWPPTAAQLAPQSIYSGGPVTLPGPVAYRGVSVHGEAPIATVQTPFLATAVVAVVDLCDAEGVMVQGGPVLPLVITPAGPDDPEGPYALVMPIRCDVSAWPQRKRTR